MPQDSTIQQYAPVPEIAQPCRNSRPLTKPTEVGCNVKLYGQTKGQIYMSTETHNSSKIHKHKETGLSQIHSGAAALK